METKKIERSPERAIIDLAAFCKQTNTYPNQKSKDPYEKALAVCISNYSAVRKNKKRRFSDEQYEKVLEFKLNYSSRSPKMSPIEKLNTLKSFCNTYGYWPSQDSEDEYERKVYATCCRDKYYKNPIHLKEYADIKNTYLTTLSSEKILDELRIHVKYHLTTPRESSKNEVERKLAKNIKYLKSRNKFSIDQLNELREIYDKFGPRGGTSIYEQILYYYLQSVANNSLVTNRNTDRFGFEVDVLIENAYQTVAVFFDGAFFHQDTSADNRINVALRDQNIVVLRFREEGCPPIDNCINIPVKKGIYHQDFLIQINQFFRSPQCPICKIISTEDIDNEKILSDACISGSSNYLVRGHLLNYIENALVTADKPKTNSKIYRNCKACFQRNQFTDKEELLYAFTKRLYDSSPRKRRDIDVPSMTNDDIELLSQIIKVISTNTPYDQTSLKEILINKINTLI